MSAAAKISKEKPQERPDGGNGGFSNQDEVSNFSPTSLKHKPCFSPFIEEAREEPFDEIKENYSKGDFTPNASRFKKCRENRENKCLFYQRETSVFSHSSESSAEREDISLVQCSENQYQNGESCIPTTLIQTSSIKQEDVDFTLNNLLQTVYNSLENNGNFDFPPTEETPSATINTAKDNIKFLNPTFEDLENLKAQMSIKLQLGQGEARYIIGLANNAEDLGLDKSEMFLSLRNLCEVASRLEADVLILSFEDSIFGKIAHVLVRLTLRDHTSPDTKIILLGDTKSGKSTLMGNLASKQLDDGVGLLRSGVHSHKHEIASGETTTLNVHMIGFEDNGSILPYKKSDEKSWDQLVQSGAKILTIFDIGGSEKVKHKVAPRLASLHPDYAILVVSASEGVTEVAEDHIRLALLYEIPLIVVITHTDLVTENCLFNLKAKIELAIRKFSSDHYLLASESEEDNLILSRTLKQKVVVPLFKISSVNGRNLCLFKNFLSLLPVNNNLGSNVDQPSEFHAYKSFVSDNKIILAGVVYKGCIKKHQVLLFGPDSDGNFKYAEVLNIRNKNLNVKQASSGHVCTIEIKVSKFAKQRFDSENNAFKSGLILTDPKTKPEACSSFVAEIIAPEDQPLNICMCESYEPVIVTHSIRQSCSLQFDIVSSEEIKNNEFENKENLHRTINAGKSTVEENNQEIMGTKNLNIIQSSTTSKQKGKRKTDQLATFKDSSLKPIAKLPTQKKNKNSQKRKEHQKKYQFVDSSDSANEEDKKVLKIQPGESRLVTFKFKFQPEYLVEGQKIVIDDNSVKCVAVVRKVLHTHYRT